MIQNNAEIVYENDAQIDNNKINFSSNIQLNDFQAAILNKMINRENNYCITLKKNNEIKLIHTNIGILSNKVGTGKTIITLALLLYKNNLEKYFSTLFFEKILYNSLNYLPKDITSLIAQYANIIDYQLITYSKYTSYENNLISYDFCYKSAYDIFLDTNLIIVPHSLFHQWKNEIIKNTDLHVKYLQSKRDFNFTKEDVKNNYFDQFDIVLCTINKCFDLYQLHYNKENRVWTTPNDNYVWKRVFIDEADLLNPNNNKHKSLFHNLYFPFIKSYFMWIITASYKKLFNTRTFYSNNNYVSNIFQTLNNKTCISTDLKTSVSGSDIIDCLPIICDEKYIQKSLQLPEIKYKTQYFRDNFFICFFSKIKLTQKHKLLIHSLNSLNYEKSIHILINIIIKNFQIPRNYVYNLNNNLGFTQFNHIAQYFTYTQFNWHKPSISLAYFNKIKYNLLLVFCALLLKKFLLLKSKILRTNNREINKKKLFCLLLQYHECINHFYDFQQIVLANKLCIFCYRCNLSIEINIENFICHNCQQESNFKIFNFLSIFQIFEETLNSITASFEKISLLRNKFLKMRRFCRRLKNDTKIVAFFLSQEENNKKFKIFNYNSFNSKIHYVVNKIKNPNPKNPKNTKKSFLIFSDNFELLEKIKQEFEKLLISYTILKGNANVINKKIEKYNNKEIQVLLLNSKYFANGLNLQITDSLFLLNKVDKQIEEQIIGRANRYNRKTNLVVNYVLYDNEKN